MNGTGRALASIALVAALAGCGGSTDGDTPVLTWLTPPDRAPLETLARECSEDSEGAYELQVEELAEDVEQRRVEVLRRLRAGDDIDVLGVDTALTSELAGSGLLAPVPAAVARAADAEVFEAALAASSVGDRLVTVPWWYDPQLLWYRGSVAQRAALDTRAPVPWSALIGGARQIGASVQVDDQAGAGTTAWVTALVAGAGGEVLSGAGREPTIGLDSDAGRRAADVVAAYAEAGVGPGPSEDALRTFVAPGGAFLLAPSSVLTDPVVAGVAAELRWTGYPVVDGEPAVPAAGVGLAVPADADRRTLAFEAISCLTGTESQTALMTGSGHAAPRVALFDDPDVTDSYPLAEVVRAGLESAVGEPVSRYHARLRTAIDATWEPTAAVGPSTPAASAALAADLIAGQLP